VTPAAVQTTAVQRAQAEYAAAVTRFNETTDPQLVDAAIHDMMAAEARVNHEVSRARESLRQRA
jgi:hypothetical protein